jgi:hypothetical protein
MMNAPAVHVQHACSRDPFLVSCDLFDVCWAGHCPLTFAVYITDVIKVTVL